MDTTYSKSYFFPQLLVELYKNAASTCILLHFLFFISNSVFVQPVDNFKILTLVA